MTLKLDRNIERKANDEWKFPLPTVTYLCV